MSIFISIASYRDPVVLNTISSAILNADSPESLYFGVVLQDLEKEMPDLSNFNNMSVIKMHPRDAMGAGYARNIAISLFDNQKYFLQIDSHTIFTKGWDSIAIDELNKAKNVSQNNKTLLSSYPPPFFVESNKDISIVKNDRIQVPYPTRQKVKLNKRNEWTADRVEFVDKNKSMPEISNTVLGGFIFAESNLIKEVPYDPEISFFGEEICFAMRAWTRGWDIYSPSKIIVYHFYTRGGYNKIWKDKNIRKISWKEIEKKSKEKQMRVLTGNESGIYGAGSHRSLKDYEKFINFNFNKHYGLTKDT